MRKPDLLSLAMMALVGTMWGLHGPALKLAFAAGFTFPQLVFGEFIVGSVAFAAAVLWQRARIPRDPRFWRILLAAAFAACGVPLFLFWAYQLGPVSIGATLLFLYVPFTQAINACINRRTPPRAELISATLVILGAFIAADFLNTANADNLRGAPFAVLAALCFAGFFVLTALIGRDATPAFRSFVCCATSVLIMLVLAGLVGWPLLPTSPPPATAALWLLGLGIFGQVIPVFLLVNFGPRTGSGLGSILTSTELPVAVGVSALVLGDNISPAQIVGIVLVIFGIVFPHLPRRSLTQREPFGT